MKRFKLLFQVTAGVAACLAVLAFATSARAGVSCGAGVSAGIVNANATGSGPVGLSSQGQTAGASIFCDYALNSFVVGAFVDYDWFLGDINDFGAKTDLTVGGRVGVKTSSTNLLYGHAGMSWIETSGPQVSAWKIGVGDEFRFLGSPFWGDLRYSYSIIDESDLGLTGADVNAHSVRLGLKVKFGDGMYGNKGSLIENAPCDPKFANCK